MFANRVHHLDRKTRMSEDVFFPVIIYFFGRVLLLLEGLQLPGLLFLPAADLN